MKKFVYLLGICLILFCSCKTGTVPSRNNIPCSDYRKAMRDFVIRISQLGRQTNASFIVIPQHGQNVAWEDDDDPIVPDADYFAAIDGCGREDTFYGINEFSEEDDDPSSGDGFLTPEDFSQELQEMCDVYMDAGLTVLSTDYTTNDSDKIADSFNKNNQKGYISFAATKRYLTEIPSYEPYNKNSDNITSLSEAKNFLYIINPEGFSSKSDFLSKLAATDYDAFVIDLFYEDEMLTASDIQQLKTKKNGGSRLVICYMSIGEAEDYRWYWKASWFKKGPDFLSAVNPEWEGNYTVKYWYPEWQAIICGENGYLSKILAAGFDGVYLDIIDAFEYFEE